MNTFATKPRVQCICGQHTLEFTEDEKLDFLEFLIDEMIDEPNVASFVAEEFKEYV